VQQFLRKGFHVERPQAALAPQQASPPAERREEIPQLAATSPKWEERGKAPCKECGQQGRVGKDGVCISCGRMLASLQPDYARLYLDYLNWRRDRMVVKPPTGRHNIETWLRRLLRLASAQFNAVSEISSDDWRQLLAVARIPPRSSLSRFVLALSPAWARELVGRLHRFIESYTESPNTRKQLREFGFRIMQRLVVEACVLKPSEISPQKLIDHRPKASAKQLHWVLGFFGRFLVAEGIWGQRQPQQFEELLTQFCPSDTPQRKTKGTAQVVPMVGELIVNCGLSPQEVRVLRVSQIESEGIRLDQKRFIPFGEGLHRISKHAVQSYRAGATPREYVFYQRHPRDYFKPIGLKSLAPRGFTAKLHLGTQRIRHFEEEFGRATNLRALHLHYRWFHKLSEDQRRDLFKTLLDRATSFVVPVPYILAMLCASRLLQGVPQTTRQGKTCSYTWPRLFGRYAVEVTWPVRFAQKLVHKQTSEKAARQLFRLTSESWAAQAKLRPVMEASDMEGELLRNLVLTRVLVRDLRTGDSWDGVLVRSTHRKRYLSLPVLERLQGGAIKSRCPVCCHPEREAIDAEVRQADKTEGRVKGYGAIARKYGLPERSLLLHAGRLTRRVWYQSRGELRDRTELQPGHIGVAPPAPTVRCPRKFVQHAGKLIGPALVLYPLLLLESTRSNGKQLQVSPAWVKERLGEDIPANLFDEQLKWIARLDLVTLTCSGSGGFCVSLRPLL
jgi:hypothetical protein